MNISLSPPEELPAQKSHDPILSREVKMSRGLRVMKSPIDRLGCFAIVRFPKEGVIAEDVGERINHLEAERRMRRSERTRISELDDDCYIDGSVGGNVTQYINHSCEPNANVRVVDGFMIIFPLREIAPGEEITIDYLNSFAEDRSVCRCRSASCKESSN